MFCTGKPGKRGRARIACISSFCRFLIRMSLVSANPCNQLKATPAQPRGLTTAGISKLLEPIPNNPAGLRQRAIILTLSIAGRRRNEVMNLKAGDLNQDGDDGLYTYRGRVGIDANGNCPSPRRESYSRPWKPVARHSPP